MGIGFVLILGSLMVLSFFLPTMHRLHPGKHPGQKGSVSGGALLQLAEASPVETKGSASGPETEGIGLDPAFGLDFSTGGDA